MNEFIFYFKMGLFHVLDIKAYDHILFLIVLAVVYQYKEWKESVFLIGALITVSILSKFFKFYNNITDLIFYIIFIVLLITMLILLFKRSKIVLWLITLFTIGHSITLALSAYGILNVRADLVEFLIPLTIFITGLMNVLTAKKASVGKENQNLFFALFFGLIHGLGFSNYFKIMIGKASEKLVPLLEFALGVEVAQIIIVFIILLIGGLIQWIFGVNRRDWILVASSIVIGFAFQMMIDRVFW